MLRLIIYILSGLFLADLIRRLFPWLSPFLPAPPNSLDLVIAPKAGGGWMVTGGKPSSFRGPHVKSNGTVKWALAAGGPEVAVILLNPDNFDNLSPSQGSRLFDDEGIVILSRVSTSPDVHDSVKLKVTNPNAFPDIFHYRYRYTILCLNHNENVDIVMRLLQNGDVGAFLQYTDFTFASGEHPTNNMTLVPPRMIVM